MSFLSKPKLRRHTTSVQSHRRTSRPRLELLEDRTMLSIFVVSSTGDNGGVNPVPGSGTGTLRQAIVDANVAGTGTAANPDMIQFNIPATDPGYNSTTGAFTIQPLSALPAVTDAVVIDGYTQPGASPNTLAVGDNAVLKIVLDGSQAGSVDGLVIGSGNSTVRGLVIDNFAAGSGLVLGGPSGNVVVGNFLGTDVTGISAAANNNGILTLAPGNTIGGTPPGARNIISGNNSMLIDVADGGTEPTDDGLYLDSSGNVIQGNYIGTDKNGTSALGDGGGSFALDAGGGIFDLSSSSNQTIGGTSAGAGNLISGNAGNGIFLGFDSLCLVAGNLIGTDATGTAALGNGGPYGGSFWGGIELWGNDNTIGGTTSVARNVISGNASYGISINQLFEIPGHAQGNLIEGNDIGTDITGTKALARQEIGVTVSGYDNTIGGNTAAARNVISGNGGGIGINSNSTVAYPAFGNAIQGNYIGTDFSGTQVVQNGAGVVFTGGVYGNSIGGALSGEGNVISGSHEFGIALLADAGGAPTQNLIQGNLIGTDKTGTTALSNGLDGIEIEGGSNNTIGGTVFGAGNTIAFNGAYGVDVYSGTGYSILANSIFMNTRQGIFLNSANNANNNQAAPVLTGVSTSSSGTAISGTLQGAAGTTYRVEFFASASMDPSGDGQGQTYLGFASVPTNAGGNASFSAPFSTVVPTGEFISATATDPGGDTSEFSKDRVVINYLVTNTDDSGPGSLREAIYDAHTLAYGTAANPDLIQFNIPANDAHHYYYRNDGVAGQVSLVDIAVTTAISDSQIPDIDPDWTHSWWSIQPASQLPTITDPVVIDGYSQPGATPNSNAMTDANPGDNAVLRIELNGGFSGSASGLSISSGNTTVQGIVVSDFGLYGISIGGGGNDTIQGDLVGTDVSGTLAEGNVSIGVLVESAGNSIGGLTAAARNVISANSFQAVSGGYDFGGVDISSGGMGNVVEGNFIGTDSSGARPLGNFGAGVMMTFGAANNTIGGTVPQARNILNDRARISCTAEPLEKSSFK
jgi:hypothetical protein